MSSQIGNAPQVAMWEPSIEVAEFLRNKPDLAYLQGLMRTPLAMKRRQTKLTSFPRIRS
jgi:hypothetical protein